MEIDAINTITGIIGLALLLIAFVLNLLKKISQNSKTYNLINFIGAGLLAYYSYTLNNAIFFILEFVWAAFALYFLIKLNIKR